MVAMFSLSTVLSLWVFVRATILLQSTKRTAGRTFYIAAAETLPIAVITLPEGEDAF
jgi:hypothetical protein